MQPRHHKSNTSKVEEGVEVIENVQDDSNRRQVHYVPQSQEERALDRAVNLKLDLCVTLPLALGFILCGIDKTNVGFVATSTFVEDANLRPVDISNSLSLFSATYVPLHWHAGINNANTLIALRLLLGAGEAGFTQIGLYFFSTVYPKYSVGWRMGLFSGMYSLAGAFAGLLSYGLLQIDTPKVHGWQVVFLFEGGLTILVGFICLALLPSHLANAWFLTTEQRAHAVRRMELDLAGTHEEADGNAGRITRRDVIDVFKDWKKLLVVTCNILTVLPVSAFTTFLPLIVQGMGYEGVQASLMSVPPFVVGVIGLMLFVWSSDRIRERSLHVVGGMLLGVIGCIVMATTDMNQEMLRYGFTHVCLAGVFVGGPLVAAWLAGNTPGKGARAVILGVNGWSNIAGVIAGQIFRPQYAPGYKTPLIIVVALVALGALGLVFLRLMYMLENKKRRKIVEDWDTQDFADEAQSTERRGDQKHTFIYGL